MIAMSIQVATLHCVRAIRYQAKSEQNVRQDPIPRVRHGEAALMHPDVRCGGYNWPSDTLLFIIKWGACYSFSMHIQT